MPPSKAEGLWAGAIPALSVLVQHPFGSPEFTSSSATIFQALIGLNQLPPYKPAEWDAMLKKLKVRPCQDTCIGNAFGPHMCAVAHGLLGGQPSA